MLGSNWNCHIKKVILIKARCDSRNRCSLDNVNNEDDNNSTDEDENVGLGTAVAHLRCFNERMNVLFDDPVAQFVIVVRGLNERINELFDDPIWNIYKYDTERVY